MAYKANISPKLRELSQRGEKGKEVKMLLADGRKVSARFEMLTYANKSDDDDTDILVASVKYNNQFSELLAEEDIEEFVD